MLRLSPSGRILSPLHQTRRSLPIFLGSAHLCNRLASSARTSFTHSSSCSSAHSSGRGLPGMSRRRHTTKTGESSKPPASSSGHHSHNHDDHHDHDGHSHSHSLFHSHAHSHSDDADRVMTALSSGKLDRGTRITLIGMASNVALTGSKFAAGLWMNSASLLAEAAHSMSDLLGDFVTLATWRIGRRPATDSFPWGYSKFETFGSLSVSVILVGGAIGIGLHSYHLLLQTLIPYIQTLPPGSALHIIGTNLPKGVPSPLLEMFHSHGPSALPVDHDHSHGLFGHSHSHATETISQSHPHDHDHALHGEHTGMVLNPHAAWFALASIVIKEWLYRITSRVAAAEHSPVLKANALHHRADAMTSGVALFSILGSSLGGYTFLDPIGGIAVCLLILKQGLALSKTAFFELLDAGISPSARKAIRSLVLDMVDDETLLGVRHVRGVKSGGQTHLDLSIFVPAGMSVRESHAVEELVRARILKVRPEVREVKMHVHGLEKGDVLTDDEGLPITSDFGARHIKLKDYHEETK